MRNFSSVLLNFEIWFKIKEKDLLTLMYKKQDVDIFF